MARFAWAAAPLFFMLAATSGAAVKWHPGHYFIDPTGSVAAVEDRLAQREEWTGAMVEVRWRDIETTGGVYDWTFVDALIVAVEKTNDKLYINFSDRNWSSTCEASPVVPDDMISWAQWPLRSSGDGCIAKIYDSAVIQRQVDLFTAFMARYDDNPTVVGINMGETAVAYLKEDPDYTAAKLIQAYKDLHAGVGAVSDNTLFVQSINFIDGWTDALREIADVIELTGNGGVGTGDVAPCKWYWDTPTGCSTSERPGYVVIEERKEALAIVLGGEKTGIEREGVQAVFDVSLDVFQVNMKGWKCNLWADFCENDLYPVLDAEGWAVNTTCPTTFAACSDGSAPPPPPPVTGLLDVTVEAVGVNAATAGNLIDRNADETQNLDTSWQNDGTKETAWYTLDAGASTFMSELRVWPRANRDYETEIYVGDTLDAEGKVTGVAPVACSIASVPAVTADSYTACALPSLQGRYVTLVQTSRWWVRFHGNELYGEGEPEAIPGVPTGLGLTEVTEGTYSFTWDPVTANPPVSDYQVDITATVRACNSLGCSEYAVPVNLVQ